MYSAVIPKFMEQAFLGLPLEVHWDGKQSGTLRTSPTSSRQPSGGQDQKGVGEAFNIANGKALFFAGRGAGH